MAAVSKQKNTGNIFLRMHPLQRILLSLAITALVFFFIRPGGPLSSSQITWQLMVTLLWAAFAISFIACSWIVFFTRPVSHIIKEANKEDGSKVFVMVSILVSSFASLFTVLLMMISKDGSGSNSILMIVVSIVGMMASWMMVHTIFAFHYAHMYFDQDGDATPGTGLAFPQEKKPDYLDFAYFSFVIGMTFQVSDVQINARVIRRTVLAHSMLSFALNTFVVALTINLVAGLVK